ncbi:MAG: hypothetical protein ACRD2A_16430 [Vicinamibacterales bacterium]
MIRRSSTRSGKQNRFKVVASAFYEQGIRFLNVGNPRRIQHVGYWIAPGTIASQAQYVPGRSDLVYVADYGRGLDVLRIDGGGLNARPIPPPPTTAVHDGVRFEPDPAFGFACRRFTRVP